MCMCVHEHGQAAQPSQKCRRKGNGLGEREQRKKNRTEREKEKIVNLVFP